MINPNELFAKEESPLKAIRSALGYSQPQFAELLGVRPIQVSRWERGVASPMLSIPQVKALQMELKKLGLDVLDLPDDLGPCAN
ncbi:MAG: helix-turn-helix domain-containing protein [Cyanothece sp. SIO1E1]|nr:helix-turn-helix domain-containing protein [Cyanothece sp. SIO1E1]